MVRLECRKSVWVVVHRSENLETCARKPERQPSRSREEIDGCKLTWQRILN
jgi:hypothetical protein